MYPPVHRSKEFRYDPFVGSPDHDPFVRQDDAVFLWLYGASVLVTLCHIVATSWLLAAFFERHAIHDHDATQFFERHRRPERPEPSG